MAAIFSVLCPRPLKKTPWLFYLLAAAISVGAVYLTYHPFGNQLVCSLVYAVQKGHLAFSFFTVVMFVGAFGRSSIVRRHLNPVRAELSIMAALLIVGHFVPYLSNYLSYAAGLLSLRPGILSSLAISVILLVLLAVLTVTSLNAIRKRMDGGHWKTLQRFSYVFFGLIFFHMLGYLAIPALSGSGRAMLNMGIYAAIFLIYAVLRIRRALLDRKAPVDASSHLESAV
jgi:DMSO/TMAO reductase YedYZ heme-binding membrane subunit